MCSPILPEGGEPSAVRESCWSAGTRMYGAALAERPVGDRTQDGLTLHGADGSNGHLHEGGASLAMASSRGRTRSLEMALLVGRKIE